eukprot:CAMPEP_0203753386 /NCGR_PEP_ID=MMETSP0098-20131031/7167_1 /ASSEMBLY_ACC=CAM_ASM_000208 /TAXON_ID=96639 /ORGANISM=" , Strain NY0313808BC1" /LENGTH=41 /DNA_ID= /DNA_START= /DNA_END= /DNA_ORIENTATION=
MNLKNGARREIAEMSEDPRAVQRIIKLGMNVTIFIAIKIIE